MPNWCWNSLTIEGEGAKEFFQACFGKRAQYKGEKPHTDTVFTFNALHPVPQEVLERGYSPDYKSPTYEEDKDKSGYHWQTDNWGTKWDIFEYEVFEQTDDFIGLNFDTAWSPVNSWVLHVASLYPNLKFTLEYHEGGEGYAGRLVAEGDGNELEEYTSEEEGYKKFVAEELNYGWEYFEDEEEDSE